MATITYISDEGVETSYPVGESEPEIHIGRHKSCNIRTTNQSVSRYHARVFFDGSAYYLQDNESVNGTFYENERLKPGEPVLVEDGHYMMCGNFELRFDLDDEDFARAGGDGAPLYEEAAEDDESTRFAQSYDEGDYYPPPPPPPPAYAPPPPPPPPAYAAPPPPPPAYAAPPPPPPVPGYVPEPPRPRASAPLSAPPLEDSAVQVEGLRADVAQRDARIQELRIEVDSLNRRLEEARADGTKAQLQQDLDNARRAANDAIARSDAATKEATELQHKLSAAQADLDQLRAQLAETSGGSRQEDERHIEALQNELQVLRESLAAAQEKFEEARAGRRNAEELASLQKMRADAAESTLATLKGEVARLQQQPAQQADAGETVSAAEYDAQVEAREEAETRAQKAEREAAQLKKQLAAAQQAGADVDDRVAQLQGLLAAEQARAEKAEAQSSAAPAESAESAEVPRLRLQLKAEKARVAQLEADLAAATANAAGGADPAALEAAQAEISRLKGELASAKPAGGGDAADLKAQLDKLTVANRELQETISANLKRIQRLTAQSTGGDSEALQRQVAQLQADLASAQAQAKAAQASASGAPDPKVGRLVQDLNGFVKSFINEFDAVADAIERIRGEDQTERDEAMAELPENLEKCQNLSQDIKNLVRDLRLAVEGG